MTQPHPDYPAELTRRHVDGDDVGRTPFVRDDWPPTTPIEIVEPDPAWPARFEQLRGRLAGALGDVARRIEHVGSTSVPGLPAKPIIDVDVHVQDTEAEEAYVPALERMGATLVIREPWWNGHRMLITPGGAANVHVFPADAPEPLRHLLFRDWLRTHPADRELYARAKRDLAVSTAESPVDYNLAKNEVIDDIYGRVFAVEPASHPAWPDGPLVLRSPQG